MTKTSNPETGQILYEHLNSALAQIIHAAGHDHFFETILQELLAVLPQLDAGFLLLYSEKTKKLIVRHAIGYDEKNYRKTQLIPGEGISGKVFQEQTPVFLTTQKSIMQAMKTMSPANLAHYMRSVTKTDYPYQSAAVPLADADGATGVIILNGHNPESVFPDQFITIFHSIAPAITLAYRYHILKNRESYLELELQLTTAALHKEHDQQQKTADLYNELTMLSNQKRGIQAMVLALYRYIKAPVALYDDLFNLIAESSLHAVPIPEGFISTREVKYVVSSKKWQVYNEGEGSSIMITPIIGSDFVIGFLLTLMDQESVSRINRMLLEYSSSLLSLELIKQQSIRETRQMINGEFMDKMLLGQIDGQVEEQAKNLGLHTKDYYAVLLCGNQSDASSLESRFELETWLNDIEEALKLYHIKGIVTQRGHQITAFLSFPEEGGKEQARRKLKEFCRYANSRIWPFFTGAGRIYEGFHDIPKSYEDAEKSLTLLRKRNNSRVYQYGDSGLYRILLELERTELESMIQDHLGPLAEHPNRDLLETLLAYTDHNKNLKNTTDQLAVHQNTLYYRLKRIEEILDISLADPEQWFDIQLACKVYEFVRM